MHVIAPEAGGDVTPSGNVPAGYSLTLTAKPEPGWKFKQWLIDGAVASEGEKELTFTRLEVDTTVEAVFEKIKAMPWLNLLLE